MASRIKQTAEEENETPAPVKAVPIPKAVPVKVKTEKEKAEAEAAPTTVATLMAAVTTAERMDTKIATVENGFGMKAERKIAPPQPKTTRRFLNKKTLRQLLQLKPKSASVSILLSFE